MLDGCADSSGLNTLYIGDRGLRRKKRIFAEIFEVASIHGSTIDVDARTEEKVDAACARIIAQHSTGAVNQVEIPGSCQRDSACQRGGRPVVADSDRPIGHLQPGQTDFLIGANIKVVDTADQIDFLLQRELLEHGIDTRLDIGWRRGCLLAYCGKNKKEKEKSEGLNFAQHWEPQGHLFANRIDTKSSSEPTRG